MLVMYPAVLIIYLNRIVAWFPTDTPNQRKIFDYQMKVVSKIVELQNALFDERKAGKTIGLVPTMGALHAGHASLVERSVKENDVTVVSVFLNPTQFNDKGDLDRYPCALSCMYAPFHRHKRRMGIFYGTCG